MVYFVLIRHWHIRRGLWGGAISFYGCSRVCVVSVTCQSGAARPISSILAIPRTITLHEIALLPREFERTRGGINSIANKAAPPPRPPPPCRQNRLMTHGRLFRAIAPGKRTRTLNHYRHNGSTHGHVARQILLLVCPPVNNMLPPRVLLRTC